MLIILIALYRALQCGCKRVACATMATQRLLDKTRSV